MKKNKMVGLIMAWTGFLILLLNSVGYYTKLNFGNSLIGIVALVLAICGIRILKKSKS